MTDRDEPTTPSESADFPDTETPMTQHPDPTGSGRRCPAPRVRAF